MPSCPSCDCELEPDVLLGVLWCWRCQVSYMLDDGYLVPLGNAVDVQVRGYL